ncbi:CbtA family protein [Bosea sp. (in: a-proteobacteria)]|uniref:CbtA family protein n=1 Tax=Bosea sp. (in: a-proteobacteria) TaxID=1871050 RepID=UPI001206380E|nr:CbtA family protein [Bosea sp. (in: a-proteobacteria)]TAJ30627.1 MAG: cobalt transporter [Bosea sp. (in: a-proteobacteria)]
MVTRVLTVSLLAGLLAGLVIAALQHVTTTPLILKAERYESALAAPPAPHAALTGGARIILAHSGTDHAAGAEHDEWKPADGLQRLLFTSATTIGTAIGFAALLLAGMIAAGDAIDPRRALIWGACGFLAFGLAPGMGLAPELPGAASAALQERQIWWLGTVAATGTGLFLFLRHEAPWLKLLAVALILLPHLVGAPHAPTPESKVPAELAAHFTSLSLGIQAALWLATAFAVGTLWPRMDRRMAAA